MNKITAAITSAMAGEIALRLLGITMSDLTELTVTRQKKQGRLEYEVQFNVGSFVYDYDIDIATGNLRAFECVCM